MVKSGRFAPSIADTDCRHALRDSEKAAGESGIRGLSSAGKIATMAERLRGGAGNDS
jgi:hypothetical protein